MSFVANFIRFPIVQIFLESIKIWQSYREFKGGNFLRHSIEVTTTGTGSHTDSQPLGEVRHCLVDVLILWHFFPDGLQGDFELITRLYGSADVYGTFPAWRSIDVIVQWVQIWRVLGPHVLSEPGQFACSQFCVTRAVCTVYSKMGIVVIKTA